MKQQPASRTFRGENGRDEFQRERVANNVIQLLTSDINLSPMIIDGDWGTGKTEFCFKLVNKFKTEHSHYRILYVDAFQADHADNPLMTLLSSVLTLFPDGEQKNSLIKKAIPVMRYGLATLGKALVSHTLKQNTEDIADGLDKTLEEVADKAIDASLKSLLKDHEKAEENLQALQNALEHVTQSAPIVIFIDELDRCRPDFAVQFLEVIKHTFDVDSLKFVLITNTRQLKAAVNHRYGAQVDSQRYLEKFLKYSFHLPDFVPGRAGRNDQMVSIAFEHFQNLIIHSSTLKDTALALKREVIYGFAEGLVNSNSLSLREIETFVRHLEIYHRLIDGFNPKTIDGYQVLRIFGVFIFCFSSELSHSVQKGRVDAQKVGDLFGLESVPEYQSDSYRWSYTLPIAVMLTQQCHINSQKYAAPSADAEEFWKEEKRNYFNNRAAPKDIFEPVRQAIFCLRLGFEKPD